MTEYNFVQLIRNDKTKFLLTEYPLAFALISFIALHARRYNGHPDGLIVGDALVGCSSICGMSRQNYRTALDKLVEDNLVKIVSNGRNWWGREKSTIKVTIKSHLVNICDSDIYDINLAKGNHDANQELTISQPSPNHKLIKNNKEPKKEKEIQPLTPSFSKEEPFIFFREFVSLTQKQYENLLTENTEPVLVKMLDILNSYKGSSGKKYKSDYHTMKKGGWVHQKAIEQSKIYSTTASVDRRTKNKDGSPVDSPLKGRF